MVNACSVVRDIPQDLRLVTTVTEPRDYYSTVNQSEYMKIGIVNESWRPEIKVRRERPRRAISYLKERGEKLLILAATFSLGINLLTRYYPELNTLALLLSVILVGHTSRRWLGHHNQVTWLLPELYTGLLSN